MVVAYDIRPATTEDGPGLGECTVRSWLEAHRGQMPDDLWRRRRDEWTPDVSSTAWSRTIREIGATAGHPSTVVVADSPTAELVGVGMITMNDHVGHVNALYVRPDHQSRGVGRALLAHMADLAAADGTADVEVSVLARNAPGRGFYEHVGAQLHGTGTYDEDGMSLDTVIYRWQVGGGRAGS